MEAFRMIVLLISLPTFAALAVVGFFLGGLRGAAMIMNIYTWLGAREAPPWRLGLLTCVALYQSMWILVALLMALQSALAS